MGGPYFDRDGRSMLYDEWSKHFDDEAYKHVAFDRVDDVEVSTVWVGISMAPLSTPPLIYETMIFGGPLSEYSWRYATLAEALDGHARALVAAREAAVSQL